MATLDSYIDWTDCELVERVPGKVSGRPIVRRTRILANTIAQDAELGSPVEDNRNSPHRQQWAGTTSRDGLPYV